MRLLAQLPTPTTIRGERPVFFFFFLFSIPYYRRAA